MKNVKLSFGTEFPIMIPEKGGIVKPHVPLMGKKGIEFCVGNACVIADCEHAVMWNDGDPTLLCISVVF